MIFFIRCCDTSTFPKVPSDLGEVTDLHFEKEGTTSRQGITRYAAICADSRKYLRLELSGESLSIATNYEETVAAPIVKKLVGLTGGKVRGFNKVQVGYEQF